MHYIGQTVLIKDEEISSVGVVVAEDEKDENYLWVFCYNPVNEDYDSYGFEREALHYIREDSKETLSGKRIYHGPFCKYKFNSVIPDKTIEKERKNLIKEIKTYTNKLKIK